MDLRIKNLYSFVLLVSTLLPLFYKTKIKLRIISSYPLLVFISEKSFFRGMVHMKVNRLFIKTKNKKIECVQDVILKLLFYFFRIFPVKKSKIVISCFKNHGYCDSPKYIVQQLLELDCDADIVWLCDHENPPEMPACIRQIPYHSIRGIYEQVTARIWISNRRKSRYVRKRKNQYYIQTWHGGIRLKNTERAAINKLSKRYIDSAKNDSKMINLFLSNSDFSTFLIRRDMWYSGKILQKGLPRTDILLNGDRDSISQKVKSYLSINKNDKILLYAPTFRADMGVDKYTLPSEQILSELEKCTENNWTFVIHMHTNVYNSKYWPGNSKKVINASSYEDVQELLIAADFLISDYSSIISDFALLNKPILLYCPDLEEYLLDRGFNQNFNDLPFPKAYTVFEVIKKLSTVISQKEINTLDWMNESYGLCETGHASKIVANIIENVLEGK